MFKRIPALRATFVMLALLGLMACAAPRQKRPAIPEPTDQELVAMLAGEVWVAEYIHGRPVIDMSHTSMVFTTDGKVNGLGGCNNYMGSYTLKDGEITFSPMASTMKMCAPALSDQEHRFFSSLAKPQNVSFENGLLHLTPENGEPSVFGLHNPE